MSTKKKIGCVQKRVLALVTQNGGKCHLKELYKFLKPRQRDAINIILERMIERNFLYREGFWFYDTPVKMTDCDNIFDWRRDVDDESPARLWVWPETVFPAMISHSPSEYGDFALINSVGYADWELAGDCNINIWG